MRARRPRKGQVAVEFISTYSWAILGVLVAIGVISYFDLMSPSKYAVDKCTTNSQIECTELEYDTTGDFKMVLRNRYPVDIAIEEIKVMDSESHSFTAMVPLLPRGNITSVPIQGTIAPRPVNSRVDLTFTVRFRRLPGGVTNFNISGTATTKVISP